jgi:hypothetical protein
LLARKKISPRLRFKSFASCDFVGTSNNNFSLFSFLPAARAHRLEHHLHSRQGTRMQMHFIFQIFFPKHTFDFSLLLNITYILGKEQGCKAFHFSDLFFKTYILILPFSIIEHQLHSRQGTRMQSISFFLSVFQIIHLTLLCY